MFKLVLAVEFLLKHIPEKIYHAINKESYSVNYDIDIVLSNFGNLLIYKYLCTSTCLYRLKTNYTDLLN